MISLYIHIPFCVKKCGYCDFISFEYDESALEAYLKDLKLEIIHYGRVIKKKVKTIFIGGGTPSILSGKQMMDLLALINEHFDMSECIEVSMESNPGTLTLENLLDYKKAGINRISMGVQTLNDTTLKTLDRIHDVHQVYESVALIKEAGFTNFNMDLMFGLPGQSLDMLKETVDKMIKLGPSHISAYSLKYEEGTDFYKKLESGLLNEIDDELDRAMYHLIEERLLNSGYFQYEISNFSKKTYECKHNLVYWEKEDYIGLGLGAHSCFDQVRFYNTADLKNYHEDVQLKGQAVIGREPIDKDEDIFEYIMLGLRLNKGIEIDKINLKYDMDFLDLYKKELSSLSDKALIVLADGFIKLTNLGRDLSNQVFMAFLD